METVVKSDNLVYNFYELYFEPRSQIEIHNLEERVPNLIQSIWPKLKLLINWLKDKIIKPLPFLRLWFDSGDFSPFKTTERNKRRYFLIGLLQLGAFAVFFSAITYDFSNVLIPVFNISVPFWLLPFLIITILWLLFLISSPKYWNMGWKGRVSQLTIMGISLILLRILGYSSLTRILAIATFLLMLIVHGPRLFITRQRMHFRELMREFRHDRIRSNISPFLNPINIFNITRNFIAHLPSRFSISARILIIFLIFGLISFLIEREINGIKNSVLFYISLWLVTGLIASLIAIIIWVIFTRRKHLVLPFEIVNSNNEELKPMAHLITHLFVDELQRVRKLLQIRQVEMAEVGTEGSLALFVTSGRDHDMVREFETLGEIKLSTGGGDITIPFAGVLSLIVTRLAHSTVRGHIQQRSDKSIDIWAEISTRGGETQTIGLVKIIPNSSNRVGEQALREKAAELAGKLTLKIGNITHIANSWESFDYFLTGLEASHEGNWWFAISNYRRAIHIEEAEQNTFGLGHYHLGAALLFQGDYASGLEHLRIARSSGPLMAETHYMVALAKIYMEANNLNNHHTFARIDKILETACYLRPSFPEAFHLWGMIYYMRARLIEEHQHEDYSFTYHSAIPYYRKSTKLLNKALGQYWSTYHNLSRKKNYSNQSNELELRRITIDLTATTHKLGDALRGQQFYSMADSYYDDVIETHPENIRTLIDRGKTYCLAQNWQRAFYYLSKRVLREHQTDLRSESYAYWQPEANLYMAWTRIGGLVAERKIKFAKATRLFYEAVAELDYALTMQPSFTHSWRETNWLPHFLVTSTILNGNQNTLKEYQSSTARLFRLTEWGIYRFRLRWSLTNNNRDPRNTEIIKLLLPFFLNYPTNNQRALRKKLSEIAFLISKRIPATFLDTQLKKNKLVSWVNEVSKSENLHSPLGQIRWLAWRADSFRNPTENSEAGPQYPITDENIITLLRGGFPNNLLEEAFKLLRKARKDVDDLLKSIELEHRVEGLDNNYLRLELAEGLQDIWEQLGRTMEVSVRPSQTNNPIQIKDRLLIDLYLELAGLRIRMLVEGGGYDLAEKTANITLKNLRTLLTSFNELEINELTETLRDIPRWFSPKILAFQKATIQAWQAFAKFHCYQDEATKQRIQFSITDNNFDGNLNLTVSNEILQLAEKAFKECRFQPLARYVEAKVLSWQDFQGHAVDRLLLILDTINAFDPHTHITSLSRRHGARQSEQLRYTEGVSGLKQFNGIMDKSIIHAKIAEISSIQSKNIYALRHFQSAVAWSPYADRDAIYFMKMARLLNDLGRMEEGLAATQEAKRRLRNIQENIKQSIWIEPRLFESFLYAKLEFRARSLYIINQQINTLPSIEDLKKWAKSGQQGYQITGDSRKWEEQDRKDFQKFVEKVVVNLLSEINNKSVYSDNASRWITLSKMPFANIQDYLRDNQTTLTLTKQIIASNILVESVKEAQAILIQYSKITNNIAYNYAQLHINLELALEKSNQSIRILRDVFILPEKLGTTPAKFNQPAEPKGILLNLDDDKIARVAIKLDTHGWVLFRQNKLDLAQQSLEIASNLLPEDPDLLYHLARVYMAQCEALWQLSEDKKNYLKEIRYFLQQSRRQLQYARRYDTDERLYSRLTRLQMSLDDYTKNWQALHSTLNQKL